MIPLATERRSQPQQIAELQARLTLVTQTHAHAHRELTQAVQQLREIAQDATDEIDRLRGIATDHARALTEVREDFYCRSFRHCRSFRQRLRWLVTGR